MTDVFRNFLKLETSTVGVTIESKDINTIPMNVANGGRDASYIQYAIVPTMQGYFYQDNIAGSQSVFKVSPDGWHRCDISPARRYLNSRSRFHL